MRSRPPPPAQSRKKGRCPRPHTDKPPNRHGKDGLMGIIPEDNLETWVLYDLRVLSAWERASADREAWGRGMTDVHCMGLNHVLITFGPVNAGSSDMEAAS